MPLRSIRFSELMLYLSFFYFLSNKLLCFNEIPSHVLFVFEIPVVQFSMTDAASLSLSDLSILPHLFPFVNPFFELFSSFFGVFQVPSSGKCLDSRFVSWVRLVYYIICFSFCQEIFWKKVNFFYSFFLDCLFFYVINLPQLNINTKNANNSWSFEFFLKNFNLLLSFYIIMCYNG